MTRRRVVVLSSALSLIALGVIAVAVMLAVTQTAYGRDRVRDFIASRVAANLDGTLYLGRMSGGLLTGVTIDSIEIRDREDSLFLASGPITVVYDPRDLIDRRILLSYLSVERLVMRIDERTGDDWNYRRVLGRGRPRGPAPERAFGDYIVIDSADIRGATFILSMPWSPADSLRGARRDSAIKVNLAREDAEIRPSEHGFKRTWRWTDAEIAASYIRIADPDSAGRLFAISSMSVNESDPPFRFRNVSGTVRTVKDSLWLNVPHFELPGSAGSANGKVTWGSGNPTRYNIRVIGDTVSLSDVAWVYPTMPTTGGGRMRLEISNERDHRVTNYAIYQMDVRTTGSRLLGAMTYGVGGPVLELKNVDMRLEPLDFSLIRQFNGAAFPVDWAGTLTGTVRASGGPLNRFRVEDAQVTFRDAHVPGAVSRGRGRGELDILFPATTSFRGFDVDADVIDLRTIQHLYSQFPRLGGTIAGRATLDSVWLDVRFRNGMIVHMDGAGEGSRVAGSGRVALHDEYIEYDLDLDAQRLSFTTLARSFPALPLRGAYAGPLRISGTVDELSLVGSLAGPGGTLTADGVFNVYGPRYAMRGRVGAQGLNVARLLQREDLPATDLTLALDGSLAGSGLDDLDGSARLSLDRSRFDFLRLHPSFVTFRLDDGLVSLDSMALRTTAATIFARGALGLNGSRRGAVDFTLAVDSLGGLRHLVGAMAPERGVFADSLSGILVVDGTIEGSLDDLSVAGQVNGREIRIGAAQSGALSGTLSLLDVLRAPRGDLSLEFSDIVAGGVRLQSASADLRLHDLFSARLSSAVRSANGPALALGADLRRVGDSTLVRLDSLTLVVDSAAPWSLSRPADIVLATNGAWLDSIELTAPGNRWLRGRASLPRDGPIAARVVGDRLPLADLGSLTQSFRDLDGAVTLDWTVSGTRSEPLMQAVASVSDARVDDLRLEHVALQGRYADRRADASLNLFRRGGVALSAAATLPVDLAIAPVARRKLDLPLAGSIRTDSVELAILETFTPNVRRASGRVVTDVSIGGSWDRPVFAGRMAVHDGALDMVSMGTRLERINADVFLSGDSVHVNRLSAWSRREGAERSDTASLTGFITFADRDNPRLGLTVYARNFQVMNRRNVARLDVSTPAPGLRLVGSSRSARLTGSVTIERGEIFIPELVQKRPINLNDPELYDIVDTTQFANRPLLPDAPSAFVQGLTLQGVRIRVGEEVWLRSAEANIKLGGEVAVTTARGSRPADPARLALEGALSADRGTYRLNLGIVQRTFEVDSGRVTFFGDPEVNPGLAISALHTVRQVNRQDVRIRVHIGGTLNEPELRLSSAEGLPISEPVLLSYLVTGTPSFDVGSPTAAASVLLPSVGSYFGTRIAGASGGLLDYVQVQTIGVGESADLFDREFGRSLLAGTRLGVGKQLSDRTFVTANAGLCRLGGQQSGARLDLMDVLGVKLEHRFNHGVAAEFGLEPASSALMCTGTLRGAIETPRQWGFDVFRAWNF